MLDSNNLKGGTLGGASAPFIPNKNGNAAQQTQVTQ